ncbi:MAG TPA: orotidine-5'-phosphate decarboxylase [Burkholderiaceae bacterium]|nr:orotidine-5'-phosphate decarboxylase [Burkholderiaceae bacterium]
MLNAAWRRTDSMLCVGLDPDPARMPAALAGRPDAVFRFCRDIVDATAASVCAFKPQIAYFSAARAEDQLEALIAHIHAAHPGIPVILDAKRGDIGATAEQYAREAFERYAADALTVNPYMGADSIEPYLQWSGRGVILLCRTSNPGGGDLQDLSVGDEKLYERVARLAAGPWNRSGELALVVGATVPRELARVRELAPGLPLLVPGIGAQGGDIDATVAAGRDAAGYGMMINSSRAILYAGSGDDFATGAARAALATRDAIREAAKRRPPPADASACLLMRPPAGG